MEAAYEEVSALHENVKLPSWNKISSMLSYCRFSDYRFTQFSRIMSNTMHSIWNCGKFLAVDEAMIPRNQKFTRANKTKKQRKEENLVPTASEDRASQEMLPKKPHKTGILCWGLTSKTSKCRKPIFWYVKAHMDASSRSFIESMFECLENWPLRKKKPVLIGDAAFCTFDSMARLTEEGWHAIMSMNTQYTGPAGYALTSFNFETGAIAFYHNSGLVMSRMSEGMADNRIRTKIILTNACPNVATRNLPLIQDHSTQNEDNVIIEVISHLNGHYTKMQLKELRMKDLREIAKKKQIPIRKTKEQAYLRVWNWLSSEEYRSQYITLKSKIEELPTKQKSALHEIYYENFNSQDIFDRELLQSLPRWTMLSWRNKFASAYLLIHLLNAYALFCESTHENEISKDEFLSKAALWLLK